MAVTYLFLGFACLAEDEPRQPITEIVTDSDDGEYLLGDLGGWRKDLSDAGYDLQLIAVNDIWANMSGGLHRGGGVMGNFYASLDIDTEKAGLWENGKFVFFGIGVYGKRPSLTVGDYQFTSSIDGYDTMELFEALYTHSFLDDRVNVLAGIHDFTLDFSVLNYGIRFINSSFWTPPTITQIPASYYPFSALGTRVKAKPTEDTYVMAGVYDGRPTNPNRLRAIDWGLTKAGGAYSIGEVGYESNPEGGGYGKLAFGAWYDSTEFVDISGHRRNSNFGNYLIGERQLWTEEADSQQGLGAFFQLAHADADRNANSRYYGLGLTYQGLFDSRDKDILSLGYNCARNDAKYRSLNQGTERSERVIEMLYRIQVTPYFSLTPDLQLVMDPSMNPNINDAVVFNLRTEVAL